MSNIDTLDKFKLAIKEEEEMPPVRIDLRPLTKLEDEEKKIVWTRYKEVYSMI